jgi:hypothetical protein
MGVLVWMVGISSSLWASTQQAQSFTFFSETQFPLRVYYIQGKKPGPTVMVQGGIQGDEPCGYLTAQILTFADLTKGNLIIVPRANYPSVVEGKRSINVDLNRRFDQEYTQYYEDYLARVIKFLVQSSDALIHLHEGSGFYCPRYVNRYQNPKCYGQSVIIDTAVYKDRIHLAETVKTVLPCLNKEIITNKYRFQLFNTKTHSSQTQYPEQRKSLTAYALQECGIPAMAIEVSKDISNITWKIKQQLRATASFLYHFGLRLELPDTSTLNFYNYFKRMPKHCHYSILGSHLPQTMTNLSWSESNALSLDIHFQPPFKQFEPSVGAYADTWPTLNLLRLPCLQPSQPVEHISLKSEGRLLGRWPLKRHAQAKIHTRTSLPVVSCLLNERLHFLTAGDELVARQGDRLVILGTWQSDAQEVLNVKGYISHSGYNNGQDKGHEIILSKEFFLSRYLLETDNPSHWRCQVVSEDGREAEELFSILVLPQKIQGIELTSSLGKRYQFPLGAESVFNIPPGEYSLTKIIGSGRPKCYLPVINGMPMELQQHFFVDEDEKKQLSIYLSNSFALLTRLYLVGNRIN